MSEGGQTETKKVDTVPKNRMWAKSTDPCHMTSVPQQMISKGAPVSADANMALSREACQFPSIPSLWLLRRQLTRHVVVECGVGVAR